MSQTQLKRVLQVKLVAASFSSPKLGRLDKPWSTTIDADQPLARMFQASPAFECKEVWAPADEPTADMPTAASPSKPKGNSGANGGGSGGADGSGGGEADEVDPTNPDTPLSKLKLGLKPEVLIALAEAGFETVGNLQGLTEEKLKDVKGVGPKTAESLVTLGLTVRRD